MRAGEGDCDVLRVADLRDSGRSRFLPFRLVHAKGKGEECGERRGVVGVSCLSFSRDFWGIMGFCREGKERASVGETRERGKERRE